MSNDRPSDVLGALPNHRPQRRSDKRVTRPAAAAQAAEPVSPRRTAKAAAPRRAVKPGAQPRAVKPGAPPRAVKPVAPSQAVKPIAPPRAVKPRTTRRAHNERLRQPAQPAGTPPSPRSRRPMPATGADILETAVHAAAELAEIGLSVSARALRNAVSRLPRP